MSLKERLRGVVATVATAAVALSVAPITAMAAAAPLGSGNATVTGVDGAASVELYKVASVTNGEDNVLVTTLEDGFNFDVEDYIDHNAEVANEIAAQLPADAEATYTAPGVNGTLEGDTATFTGIDAGLYLVKVNPEQAGWSYQTMILSVVPAADAATGTWGTPTGTVELKANTDTVSTTLQKKVSLDGETWVDSVDEASYGDPIYFQVSVQIPEYNGLTSDSDIKFQLIDRLPDELDYVSGTNQIQVDGKKAYFSGTGFTNPQENNELRIGLNAADLIKYAGKTLTFTFQAELNSCNLAGEFTNVAYVNWYKHVTDDQPTKSDEVDASVIVYGTNVTKVVGELVDNKVVGSSDGEKINGAVFQLEKKQADGSWKAINTNVEANPTTSTIKSLGAGEYRWVEIQSPAGYQLNETPLEFEIGDGDEVSYVDAKYFGDLEDTTGAANLPQTGGPGTIALTVAGAGLVAGAAYLVMRSRKEN